MNWKIVARTGKAIVFVAVAATISILVTRPATAQGSGHKDITIPIHWALYGVHGTLCQAAQKGWFKENGLSVTILDGKGSASTLRLLCAEKVDIAMIQLSTMAATIDKGLPIISIAGSICSGKNGILVPNDSPIKSAKDFVGKRVVYPSGSSSASLLEALFRVGGVRRDKLNLIGFDSIALSSTYVPGDVDGAITTIASLGPMITDKRASRGVLFADGSFAVPSFGLVICKRDEAINSDSLAMFLAANVRAWKYEFAEQINEAIDEIVAQCPTERLDHNVMTWQLRLYLNLMNTPATRGKIPGWQDEGDWTQAV